MAGRATASYNFAAFYPTLAAQWSPRNLLPPSAFTPMSSIKVWWLCTHGHEWQAPIYSRAKGIGCPHCSGRLSTSSHNLAILYPTLAQEWSPHNPKPPDAYTPKSGAKVWWLCVNGHEWLASIYNRARGSGCPGCSGRSPTRDYNLVMFYPALAQEWSPRNPKPADAYTPKSGAKVWWLCAKGHGWQAIISSRAKGTGCPYCSGRFPSLEYNLATAFPALASEWSPRNKKSPHEFTPKAEVKVLWLCSYGHEWPAYINNRARGSRCPVCVASLFKSTPEVALVNHLVAWLNQQPPALDYAIPGLHWPTGYAVTPDFAVADGPIKFVVEYDGIRFHGSRTRIHTDLAKTRMLANAGFLTIRIREAPLPVLASGCDLVLTPTLIYRDRTLGFPYLITRAQKHIDQVCRHQFGDRAWDRFLRQPGAPTAQLPP